MLTTGEAISAVGKFSVNQGSNTVETDQSFRDRALFFLTTMCKRVWNLAPWWFQQGSGTITVATSSGSMPANFSRMGTNGQVYDANGTMLTYLEPGPFYALRTGNPSATASLPTHWTLGDVTAVGLSTIQVYPTVTSSVTLSAQRYVKRMPDLIDRPAKPTTVDSGVVGLPTGAYTYKVTFVNPLGETEPSAASTSLTVSLKKITVTIPVSSNRSVTSRKIYRTAASGTSWLLLATISDNTTTTYLDNIADGSLGAAAPTLATAVTGFEAFPEDIQEPVLIEGLIAKFRDSQDDAKAKKSEDNFEAEVKRAWSEWKQGQNVLQALPAFGDAGYQNTGRDLRSRLMGS